jgi:hypothetical protein
MKDGLFAPAIVSFVFAPLVVTVALLLAIWWKRMRRRSAGLDAAGLVLASAVCALPEARREWGAAMLAELGQIHDLISRWRFALGCARVALFPPPGAGVRQWAGRSPVCGMLAVALPPLGLPLIYCFAVMAEAIGGSPFTQASRWSNAEAAMVVVNIVVKLLFVCLLAGLPLGLAGWLRRERLRWLSVLGMILTVCLVSYFVTVMHFTAGGPHGD